LRPGFHDNLTKKLGILRKKISTKNRGLFRDQWVKYRPNFISVPLGERGGEQGVFLKRTPAGRLGPKGGSEQAFLCARGCVYHIFRSLPSTQFSRKLVTSFAQALALGEMKKKRGYSLACRGRDRVRLIRSNKEWGMYSNYRFSYLADQPWKLSSYQAVNV